MSEQAAEGTGTSPETPAETEWKPPASQADLDRIINERLARQKAQFKDYDDLKTKAAEFDKLNEAQKTEAQRAADAIAAAERKAADVQTVLRAKTAENALLNAAAGKLRVPSDAVLHLASKVEVDDDGNVDQAHVAALVDGLLEERQDLAATNAPTTPRPNPAQGTSGRPAPSDPRAEFAQLFGAAANR